MKRKKRRVHYPLPVNMIKKNTVVNCERRLSFPPSPRQHGDDDSVTAALSPSLPYERMSVSIPLPEPPRSLSLSQTLYFAHLCSLRHAARLLRPTCNRHAGYSYSGPAAAWGYKNIDPNAVHRVFLLGPSHHVFLRKCALSRAGRATRAKGSGGRAEAGHLSLRSRRPTSFPHTIQQPDFLAFSFLFAHLSPPRILLLFWYYDRTRVLKPPACNGFQ